MQDVEWDYKRNVVEVRSWLLLGKERLIQQYAGMMEKKSDGSCTEMLEWAFSEWNINIRGGGEKIKRE